MKGVVISLALIVGGLIYVVSSYTKIGQAYIDSVAKEEGDRDKVLAAVAAAPDDQAFIRQYLPFLKRRYRVCVAAQILDDDYFVKLGRETLALYDETPLQAVEPYGNLLAELGLFLTRHIKPPVEGFQYLKKHKEFFPNSKKANVVISAMNSITINYGMQ